MCGMCDCIHQRSCQRSWLPTHPDSAADHHASDDVRKIMTSKSVPHKIRRRRVRRIMSHIMLFYHKIHKREAHDLFGCSSSWC